VAEGRLYRDFRVPPTLKEGERAWVGK